MTLKNEQFILEPLFVDRMHSIGRFLGDTASVQVTADLFDDMLVTFQAQMLAGQTANDTHVYTVEHPATWWQHLKLSRAPSWFTKRWPVSYAVTRIKADWKQYATYPRADMGLPAAKFGYPITINMAETEVLGSPYKVERLADEPSKPAYISRHELVSRLYGTEAMRSLERPSMTDYPPSPQAMVYVVLDGLKEVGVNPDELLRATA